jgi:hypothetical protein
MYHLVRQAVGIYVKEFSITSLLYRKVCVAMRTYIYIYISSKNERAETRDETAHIVLLFSFLLYSFPSFILYLANKKEDNSFLKAQGWFMSCRAASHKFLTSFLLQE